MEFKAGDSVVHPTYGVGQIVRLEERQLAEDEPRLYYVIVADKSTVWVPVNADPVAPLRKVTSKHEMERYRNLLKSNPMSLEKDPSKRRLEIATRLRRGSFQSLCEVVRDLTAVGWYGRINEGDAAFLLKARDNLSREWAAAAGMSVSKAIQEVDALLLAGREAHRS